MNSFNCVRVFACITLDHATPRPRNRSIRVQRACVTHSQRRVAAAAAAVPVAAVAVAVAVAASVVGIVSTLVLFFMYVYIACAPLFLHLAPAQALIMCE